MIMRIKTKVNANSIEVLVFNRVRQLLLKYGDGLIIRVDQWESLYLEYPDWGFIDQRSGTLFGAVQIMNKKVAIYLPELMYRREGIPFEYRSRLSGYMNDKGILYVYLMDNTFLVNLEALILHLSCQAFPNMGMSTAFNS